MCRFIPDYRIGIIEFAEGKAGKLFPELGNGRDGQGQAVSKYWARYRRKGGLSDIRNKDFLLFNTFSTMLYRAGVVPMLVSEIVGHMNGDGKRGEARQRKFILNLVKSHLRDALERLDYGEEAFGSTIAALQRAAPMTLVFDAMHCNRLSRLFRSQLSNK